MPPEPNLPLLQRVIREPSSMPRLSLSEWDQLIPVARRERLLGYLGALLERHSLASACPEQAVCAMRAYRIHTDFLAVQARREIAEIQRALSGAEIPLLLLKGAAYQFRGYPWATGRLLSDVDLLLPRSRLKTAEARLLAAGWESQTLDSYDQRYYRTWMHELPPLRHRNRSLEVDLHHALLPPSGRLRPDAQALWQRAQPVGDGLFTLCPTDMLLHSAAHLFQDGDLSSGLRDLVDLHEMFHAFGQAPGFWPGLVPRARQLQLTLPLYYAVDCGRRLLGSPIPASTVQALEDAVERPLSRHLTRILARRVLTPRGPGQGRPAVSAWLLYVRSHWLRMPAGLLARHLGRKLLRRAGIGETRGEQTGN